MQDRQEETKPSGDGLPYLPPVTASAAPPWHGEPRHGDGTTRRAHLSGCSALFLQQASDFSLTVFMPSSRIIPKWAQPSHVVGLHICAIPQALQSANSKPLRPPGRRLGGCRAFRTAARRANLEV